ncbi:hypothetical protein [Agathobacter rectalis]|jgi:hypothetical protein
MAAMKSGVQSKKENGIIRWVYESVFYQIDFVKLRLKMMEYEKEKVYFLIYTVCISANYEIDMWIL